MSPSPPAPWYAVLGQRWPDFVVTFLGVFLAAALSYWISRRLDAREQKIRELHERRHLLAHIQRVARETRDNEQWIGMIHMRLGKAIDTKRAGYSNWESVVTEALEWAEKQGDALSVAAYDDLGRSGLQRLLPDEIQDDLFDSRQRVVDAKAALRAAPAHAHMAWRLNEPIDILAENVRVILDNAATILVRVREPINKYVSSLKREFTTNR